MLPHHTFITVIYSHASINRIPEKKVIFYFRREKPIFCRERNKL